MPSSPSAKTVAEVVVGAWGLGATSLPEWLDGSRTAAHVQFSVVSPEPLVVREEQRYTSADGKERVGIISSNWANGQFVSRGSGVRRISRGRWRVLGVTDDHNILVIRTERSATVSDGVMVLVRVGADGSELRTTIATSSEDLGLTPEVFASLGWLPLTGWH